MRPKLFFDIDGTYEQKSLLISYFEALVKEGIFPQEIEDRRIEFKAMWASEEIHYDDYIGEVVRLFLFYIKFVYEVDALRVAKQVIEDPTLRYYKYVAALVGFAEYTHERIAISKSPGFLTRLWAEKAGFDLAMGTEYLVGEDGIFTGETVGYEKADVVKEHLSSLSPEAIAETIAVGDSADDIMMLLAVAKPLAFNPDEKLLEAAVANGWPVWVERKSILHIIN